MTLRQKRAKRSEKKNREMLEKEIEKLLVKTIKLKRGLIYKFTSPGNDGVPDRIIILNGKIYFVELKTESGKLSSIQKNQIRKILSAGGEVIVLRGAKGVPCLMRYLGEDKEADLLERRLERRYARDGKERQYEKGCILYGKTLSDLLYRSDR